MQKLIKHFQIMVSKIKCYTIILIFIFFSCSNKKNETNADFVVKVGNKTLTASDLQYIFAAAANTNDSALFVQNYLKKWVAEELIYAKAQKKFKNDTEIENMVDEYRKSLIVNKFKQKLLEENNIKPTSKEIADYYEQHKSELKLDEPILKGALLQVSKNSPKTDQLRDAMKKMDIASIEKIEKYSLKYAINYDFFTDKWLTFNDIALRLPIPQGNKDAFVSARNFYELQDSTSIYFLSIKEFRISGAETPLEKVNEFIVNTLITQKSLQFVKDYQQKLYDNALKKGEIIIK